METSRSTERALPDQLRRERLVDLERRLAGHRRGAFALLAVALLASGPWLGWLWLAPLAIACIAFAVTERRVATSDRPERWVAAVWALSPVLIAASVALTGGPESPATIWFALPAVTLAARFEPRGVLLGLGFILALLLASTIGVDLSATLEDPPLVIFPVAATAGVVILSGALAGSEREHRTEAMLDPLTGLLNRSALSDRFEELEALAARRAEPEPIDFLIGDIDHFKRINDVHGHDRGDQVLRDVADALRGELRAYDLIYRVGGEEFVGLLPGAEVPEAAEIAERLRRAVAGTSSADLEVTMSIGVTSGNGAELDFAALYKRADVALYEAKRAGRNRVHVTEPPGPTRAHTRLEMTAGT